MGVIWTTLPRDRPHCKNDARELNAFTSKSNLGFLVMHFLVDLNRSDKLTPYLPVVLATPQRNSAKTIQYRRSTVYKNCLVNG